MGTLQSCCDVRRVGLARAEAATSPVLPHFLNNPSPGLIFSFGARAAFSGPGAHWPSGKFVALSSAYINRFNAPFAGSEVAVRKPVLCHVHLQYFIFGALAWLWMKELALLGLLNIIPKN